MLYSKYSGVTRMGGRTAPGDTLQGVTPEGKIFCGWMNKEQWTNEVGQVKKGAGWHPSETNKSDSDEQKKVVSFSVENK